ncbi:MAG: dockerin type I repeat-containing protein [Ruminococcus sp.]|nr:dockerin type I repeat-containing protein [Ruminococcus sp.]
MKKLSKVLAVVSCAAITFASLGSVNSEAICIMIDNVFEAPEGYTEFDDKGSLQWAAESKDNDDYTVYKKYYENGNEDVLIYHDYKYNYTVFNIVNAKIDIYDSIYEKYSDKLNMQYYYRGEPPVKQPDFDVEAVIYDMYDADGYVTKDPSKMEDKYDLIMEMAAEMYDAGCITEATYKSVTANLAIGESSAATVQFKTENPTEEEKSTAYDKIQEVISDFENVELFIDAQGRYRIKTGSECFDELLPTIEEACPNVIVFSPIYTFLLSSSNVDSGSVDLLAAIGEFDGTITYGDLNADGSVGIRDAILMNKAVVGAITLNEAQAKAADVNGDGAVNGDDLNILLNFLVNNIDTLPADK